MLPPVTLAVQLPRDYKEPSAAITVQVPSLCFLYSIAFFWGHHIKVFGILVTCRQQDACVMGINATLQMLLQHLFLMLGYLGHEGKVGEKRNMRSCPPLL